MFTDAVAEAPKQYTLRLRLERAAAIRRRSMPADPASASSTFRLGAPWESYITDPADHPDPAAWRTDVCWPLEK